MIGVSIGLFGIAILLFGVCAQLHNIYDALVELRIAIKERT